MDEDQSLISSCFRKEYPAVDKEVLEAFLRHASYDIEKAVLLLESRRHYLERHKLQESSELVRQVVFAIQKNLIMLPKAQDKEGAELLIFSVFPDMFELPTRQEQPGVKDKSIDAKRRPEKPFLACLESLKYIMDVLCKDQKELPAHISLVFDMKNIRYSKLNARRFREMCKFIEGCYPVTIRCIYLLQPPEWALVLMDLHYFFNPSHVLQKFCILEDVADLDRICNTRLLPECIGGQSSYSGKHFLHRFTHDSSGRSTQEYLDLGLEEERAPDFEALAGKKHEDAPAEDKLAMVAKEDPKEIETLYKKYHDQAPPDTKDLQKDLEDSFKIPRKKDAKLSKK